MDQNKKKSVVQDLGWDNYCQSFQGVLPGDSDFSVSPSPGVEAIWSGRWFWLAWRQPESSRKQSDHVKSGFGSDRLAKRMEPMTFVDVSPKGKSFHYYYFIVIVQFHCSVSTKYQRGVK